MTTARRERDFFDVASRLGLNRDEAAFYIHVALPTWNRMVRDGLMPQPKQVGNRYLWDRREIELAFSNLPTSNGVPILAAADADDGW